MNERWPSKFFQRRCPAIPIAFSGFSTRILSTLNHLNVLAIFDVGEQAGTHYLVSEFLEGQSLRETLTSGPLPLRVLALTPWKLRKG